MSEKGFGNISGGFQVPSCLIFWFKDGLILQSELGFRIGFGKSLYRK